MVRYPQLIEEDIDAEPWEISMIFDESDLWE